MSASSSGCWLCTPQVEGQAQGRVSFKAGWSRWSEASTEAALEANVYFCRSQSLSLALQASCSPFCSLGLQKPIHQCPLWDTRLQRAGRCQRHCFCWRPCLGSLCTTIAVLSGTGFSGADSALALGAACPPGLTPSTCPIPLATWMDGVRAGQRGARRLLLGMLGQALPR